ncbi:hypothetical protein [Pedobacter insulae]|uniref:Outer membrane insertion C-terminal signal n=1 Tax=Pedobacter insulae TaxID=414048 RepID=A0A1I2ZC63_9SPHI|nr:hypothetical protein [Pedobacter insulae]SFH35106.1 hypothetical protein SAMN04489864_109130 [Pedobacter insulae]
MKKLIFTFITGVALFTVNMTGAKAQDYKTGLGLAIDFGDGATLVGPHIKHFFNANGAINGEVLFGNHFTRIQGMYQHHSEFKGADGLKWYIGGGPAVDLYDGGSSFYLVPTAGLDLKVKSAPIALSFDWRPNIYLGDSYGGNRFIAGRFGLGIRYSF